MLFCLLLMYISFVTQLALHFLFQALSLDYENYCWASNAYVECAKNLIGVASSYLLIWSVSFM